MEYADPKKVKEKLDSVGCGFCLAKWTQVTIHLGSGLNHSCHHVRAHTIPVEEVKKNPNVLHNTRFKKDRRKEMLSGERPSECDYCWRIEDNTDKFSDRVWKSRDEFSWPMFHKISKSTGNEDFYPRYVEVSFSNVCNFKCGYCGPAFSSKWMDEIKQHGPYTFSMINWRYNEPNEYQTQIPEREDNPYIEAFWKWFPEAVKHMTTFRITGGEPLLSKHTFKVIDYLIENPQPNLEFAINSNACPPGNMWQKFVKRIKMLQDKKCIKEFTLFVSAEAKGKQQEYSRFGMDWGLFVDNVKHYLKETRTYDKTGDYDYDAVQCRMSVMAAFNIFSFPTFLPFLKYVLTLKQQFKNRVSVDIPFVRNPGFLDGKIATKAMVKKFLFPCVDFMEQYQTFNDEGSGNGFSYREIDKLKRIIKDLNHRLANPKEFEQIAIEGRRMFFEYVKQYDKRRGTNFMETFPELQDFFRECKSCMI